MTSVKKPTLTAERLREVLHYEPATGVFTWRMRLSNRIRVGSEAGTYRHLSRDRYRRIMVDGHLHYVHRLAWLYVHGEWPVGEIDHARRAEDDNSVSHLRLATRSQQMANSRKRVGSKTPYKGVAFHKGRPRPWQARIRKDYVVKSLGYFATPEEAHAAYFAAAKELFGEFACGG